MLAAAEAQGRSADDIQLLAVSKTRPVEDILALNALGQSAFGENYLQEALQKIEALSGSAIEWHFIGPVQSNKTREIAAHFDWLHSLDRLKIAQRLNEQRGAWQPPLNVCIQVNISQETSKAGLPPSEVATLCAAIMDMPRLRLRGLMAIPAATKNPIEQQKAFSQLAELQAGLIKQGHALDTLSMGMSADLEAAVAAGSTMLRIGTDLFGPRQ